MKRFLLGIVVLAVVSAMLNPSQDDHQQAVRENFRQDHPIMSAFGLGYLASAMVAYRSYGVFSVGLVGEDVVSVGALGQVVVLAGK